MLRDCIRQHSPRWLWISLDLAPWYKSKRQKYFPHCINERAFACVLSVLDVYFCISSAWGDSSQMRCKRSSKATNIPSVALCCVCDLFWFCFAAEQLTGFDATRHSIASSARWLWNPTPTHRVTHFIFCYIVPHIHVSITQQSISRTAPWWRREKMRVGGRHWENKVKIYL